MPRGTPTRNQRTIIVASALLMLIISLSVFGYFVFAPTLGTQLQGQLIVTYSDGSQAVYNTASSLWDQLSAHSVIQMGGKTIQNLALTVNLLYHVSGGSKSVTAQYWAIFWVENTGPAGAGVRANLPVFGNVEYWAQDYGSRTMWTTRWVYLQNGLGGAFGPQVGSYYAEQGSGLQLGNINLGPDQAVNVNSAVGGNPVVGGLANQLTTILGTVTRTDGQTENVISWSKKGPQFFTDMWSISYPWQLWSVTLPGGSLCIPYTGYCAGAGAYLRMHEGDQYSMPFKAAIFYRWQDATGFWTSWNEKTVTIATLNLQVTSGYYTLLSVDVGGNVGLS